jgi:hypothetical protein
MMNSIIDLLILKDQRSAVKRCWIARTVEEVVDRMSDLKCDETTRLYTNDFTTMYTQLPHEDFIKGVCGAIDEAEDELLRRHMMTRADPPLRYMSDGRWSAQSTDPGDWSCVQLKEALALIVSESYVMNGFTPRRQRLGVPMGQESSPPGSNLYLYSKEAKFVDEIVQRLGEQRVLREYDGFRHNCRFIDDTLSNLPYTHNPSSADYGGLGLHGAESGVKVNYLGLTISVNEGPLPTIKVRDKSVKFNFDLVRYPTVHTNVPAHSRIGTLVGMLVRSVRYTTTITQFREEIPLLLRNFATRGYGYAHMNEAIRKFVFRNVKKQYRNETRTHLLRTMADTIAAADPTALLALMPQPVHCDAQFKTFMTTFIRVARIKLL